MERKEMYYSTHAIKINKDCYKPGLNISLFLKSILLVLLKGESPVGHRPYYSRKHSHS